MIEKIKLLACPRVSQILLYSEHTTGRILQGMVLIIQTSNFDAPSAFLINDVHTTFQHNMVDRSYTFTGIQYHEIYVYYRVQILYVSCHFVTPVVQGKAAALTTSLF